MFPGISLWTVPYKKDKIGLVAPLIFKFRSTPNTFFPGKLCWWYPHFQGPFHPNTFFPGTALLYWISIIPMCCTCLSLYGASWYLLVSTELGTLRSPCTLCLSWTYMYIVVLVFVIQFLIFTQRLVIFTVSTCTWCAYEF